MIKKGKTTIAFLNKKKKKKRGKKAKCAQLKTN